MSGSRFPVGLCTLLVNHHGIPEPSELVLGACFPLKPPFRSMLLTLRGGPESLAPRAHRIPVYPMVFPHSYTVLSRRTGRTWSSHRTVLVRLTTLARQRTMRLWAGWQVVTMAA